MSRSTVAVLLSLLVLPGAGHLYLKRRGRALLFLVPALAAVLYVISDAMTRASAIADQILSGRTGMDPVAISAQLEGAGPTPLLVSIAIWVMIAAWIGSAVDAWLIARAQTLPR